MTDLLRILPSFPIDAFPSLLPTIERHALTTSDLLTLHPTDLAKQTHLPILDLRRLLAAIQSSLTQDLVSHRSQHSFSSSPSGPQHDACISTLDQGLDDKLGGGVPVGCVTEFVGESGVGKSQFLLTLCLAVQLSPPRGLGRNALYISTESGLATPRLAQMIRAHPGTSLDGILATVVPDLESQEHILEYQVPVMLARGDIGLLVLDSVAANYRAEFDRQSSQGSNMAARGAELIRLGALLRDLATKHCIAVVVANQVADRFAASSLLDDRVASLSLDHQQRWFSGWGDDPADGALKTPSLGLVWSTQISCRVALFKRPVYGQARRVREEDGDGELTRRRTWRRWIKVVFAPHVRASAHGITDAVEFEITTGGVRSVGGEERRR